MGITVGELKDMLENYDDDEELFVLQPTHDYWHHVQVLPLDFFDHERAEESGYCGSLVVNEDSDKMFLVLGA